MQVNNELDTRPVVDIWPVVALAHKYVIYRVLVPFDEYNFSNTRKRGGRVSNSTNYYANALQTLRTLLFTGAKFSKISELYKIC